VAGTVPASLANGDVLTAMVDGNGVAIVWKTTGATTTFLGSAQLPNNALWTTGGGRIGMHLLAGARVDNFAGGNAP
jgi:hypothetical protein